MIARSHCTFRAACLGSLSPPAPMHCRVCSGGSYAPVTITEYSRRTLLTRRFEFGLRYKRDIRVNYTIKTLSRKNDSTMRVQCTLRGFQDTLKKATIMLQTDKSLWVTLSDEIHWQIWSRGRHQPFVSGAVWNCQGDHRVGRRGRGPGSGCLPFQKWGSVGP